MSCKFGTHVWLSQRQALEVEAKFVTLREFSGFRFQHVLCRRKYFIDPETLISSRICDTDPWVAHLCAVRYMPTRSVGQIRQAILCISVLYVILVHALTHYTDARQHNSAASIHAFRMFSLNLTFQVMVDKLKPKTAS